uniref:DUF1758 domain-containing protein n=1 Tax=Heterorhabditis bacteriophora TaxID=37862 RepID=A0A1I7XEU1_HETBA
MSGPIRSMIGRTNKRLQTYVKAYEDEVKTFLQPLSELTNDVLLKFYHDIKRHLEKIEKTANNLDSIHTSWIQHISTLTNLNDRDKESKIYEEYLHNYGDYTVSLNQAKDTIEEIISLKELYKNEILDRKEEGDVLDDDINISTNNISSVSTPVKQPLRTETNIIQAAPTLSQLLPVKIPLFFGEITKWSSFWETFNTMVHSQDISDCIKFYYLKSYLRDDAFRLVSGLSADSYNYPICSHRIYDDNRRIQFSIKPDYKPNRFPTLYKHTNDHADRDTMPSSTFSAATSTRNIECAYCHNKSHKSSACKAYPTIDSRKKRSMELRLCFNCLAQHTFKDCKSKATCKICRKKHHTTLCLKNSIHSAPKLNNSAETNKVQSRQVTFASTPNVIETPIKIETSSTNLAIPSLPTDNIAYDTLMMCTYVNVENPEEPHNNIKVLAFLDSEQLYINTFADATPTIIPSHKHSLNIRLKNNARATLAVTSLDNMTNNLRFVNITKYDIQRIKRQSALHLPYTSEKPAILIGSDYLWDILKDYSYTILPSGFLLLDTKIGNLITGKRKTVDNAQYDELQYSLEKFWKLESIGIHDKPELSDDEECMRMFASSITKNNERYTEKWPWKSPNPQLPTNLGLCTSRLYSVLKKLSNDKILIEKYDKIFKEQLALNIIEIVDPTKTPDSHIVHYLPHHPVITPQKSTTKLRIVYDASAKLKNYPSLNECLYRGPVLLPDLCGILLRLRLAPIVRVSLLCYGVCFLPRGTCVVRVRS